MPLAVFKTVRGRLLALLVAITLPIACLTAAAAVSTYRSALATIAVAQVRIVDDFAIRTRVWYRGALRSALAAGATLAQFPTGATDCGVDAEAILRGIPGYVGLRVALPGRPVCAAVRDAAFGSSDLARISEEMARHPPVPSWAGSEIAETRYGQIERGGRRYLTVAARSVGPDGVTEMLLVASPGLLNNVFDLGAADPGTFVALASRGGDIVLARNMSNDDEGWLPQMERLPNETERWEAESRAGQTRTYAARLVAAPDLYLIASFDEAPARAASTQFLLLLAAPLLTLALLCIVYMRAIDRHCVRWLRGIEAVARARASTSKARIAVSDAMPRDIRSVADAFNSMADEEEVRRRKLQLALDDNRYLVRELHHRVKNSLQVVQSYLGLTKREHQGEARLALSDAECRIHVLSAAYRFTLADGEMQPVRIDLFLEDVVAVLSNLVRRGEQSVLGRFETEAALPIDRIIPLGFLIVDVVSRGLRACKGLTIAVAVRDIDATTIEIAIEADREVQTVAPPRLFAGLLAQVEAVEITGAAGRNLGVWRLRHGD